MERREEGGQVRGGEWGQVGGEGGRAGEGRGWGRQVRGEGEGWLAGGSV